MPKIRRSPSGPSLTPRYEEIPGEIFRAGGGSDFTFQAYRNTPYKMFFCRHDQNDEGHFRYALPNSWSRKGLIEFVTHVVPAGAGSGNVVFDGYYAWTTAADGELPVLSGWTAFRGLYTVSASDQYMQKRYTLFSTTAPTEHCASDTSILIYLRRPGLADSADTYNATNPDGLGQANLGFIATRIRYQVDSFGSRT